MFLYFASLRENQLLLIFNLLCIQFTLIILGNHTTNRKARKTMSETIRVSMAQQRCAVNHDQNLANITQAAEQAASEGAQLLLLQELHNGPYFCQVEDQTYFQWAETIPGPSTEFLGALARRCNLVIVGSLFEKRASGLYHNTAVVLDRNGELAGFYRKMHIPDDPGYYEKYYFTPGDLGFQPIQSSLGKLGVLVCWDQWFPEAARLQALAGADLLLYPTAIGWDSRDNVAEQQRQLEAWKTIQRAHAIANGLPVLACNRIGHEPDPSGQSPGIDFWGSSLIIGTFGEVIAAAESDQVSVTCADIVLADTERHRQIWPFLRDRRIDAYDGILTRYRD